MRPKKSFSILLTLVLLPALALAQETPAETSTQTLHERGGLVGLGLVIGPKVGAVASPDLLLATIREASFDATWRTASAPVARMPASISAAGVAATTPMALSGQSVQQRPQPVQSRGSKLGNASRDSLKSRRVELSGGIVPDAR